MTKPVDQEELINVDVCEGDHILYEAEFNQLNEFVSYKTILYIVASFGLILAYGFGLLMLLWLPVMRHIWRKEFTKRRLYLTGENIVYRTEVPVCMPCCGSTKREKHILLSLLSDVILEQGCLQARYGLHSIKLENAGQGGNDKKSGCDVSIVGIKDAAIFKRTLLAAAAAKRRGIPITDSFIQAASVNGSVQDAGMGMSFPMGSASQFTGSGQDNSAMHETLKEMRDTQKELNTTMTKVLELMQQQQQQQQQPQLSASSMV